MLLAWLHNIFHSTTTCFSYSSAAAAKLAEADRVATAKRLAKEQAQQAKANARDEAAKLKQEARDLKQMAKDAAAHAKKEQV